MEIRHKQNDIGAKPWALFLPSSSSFLLSFCSCFFLLLFSSLSVEYVFNCFLCFSASDEASSSISSPPVQLVVNGCRPSDLMSGRPSPCRHPPVRLVIRCRFGPYCLAADPIWMVVRLVVSLFGCVFPATCRASAVDRFCYAANCRTVFPPTVVVPIRLFGLHVQRLSTHPIWQSFATSCLLPLLKFTDHVILVHYKYS